MTDAQATIEAALDAATPHFEAYLAERHEASLLVGVTLDGVRGFRALRSPDAQLAAVPSAESVFEIGSVSKVFNAVLLGVLEGRGMLSLDDPIGTLLPQLSLAPEVAEITVFDLATHSAGLDRMGTVFNKMYEEDVRVLYLRYRKEDLYRELEQARLVRPRGSGWEYSIVGNAALGHVLELVGGKPWETLLRELVCAPLGLDDTAYQLSDEQLSRMVRGYDKDGELAPLWYWDVMLPQGGLRSTMNDLLTFLEACWGTGEVPDALRRTRRTHFTWPEGFELAPGIAPPFQQGLAWRTFDLPFGVVDEHNGATLSYQSQIGVCESARSGFAALTCYDRAGFEDASLFPSVAATAMRSALEILTAT